MSSNVSFTVRRPTPTSRPSSSGPESDGPFKVPALPRHLASASSSATGSPLAGSPQTFSFQENSDSDNETGIVFTNGPGDDDNSHHTDSSDEGNLANDSKRVGGQRFHQKKKKVFDSEGPLVIPTQPNPDWHEAARRRRAACSHVQPHMSRAAPSFVPDSALAATGADGSVGGLGTRDTINSGPQLSGLQTQTKKINVQVEAGVEAASTALNVIEETEDQRALRAILAGEDESASAIDIIPVPPLSEADALKQDIQGLPDVATANDYERVPISAFGAAMLRGMGWTDGAVASKLNKKRKNGLSELYLPQARPALLGIGAKEREADDDGSKKNKYKGKDMRYIPLAKKEDERGEGRSSRSGTVSRYSSRSPPRREREDYPGDQERSVYDDRERRKERGDEGRRRARDYSERTDEQKDYRDRDRDRDIGRDRGRRGSDRDREQDGKRKQYDQPDRTRERDRRNRRGDR